MVQSRDLSLCRTPVLGQTLQLGRSHRRPEASSSQSSKALRSRGPTVALDRFRCGAKYPRSNLPNPVSFIRVSDDRVILLQPAPSSYPDGTMERLAPSFREHFESVVAPSPAGPTPMRLRAPLSGPDIADCCRARGREFNEQVQGAAGHRHSCSSLGFLAWVVQTCGKRGKRASVALHSLIAYRQAQLAVLDDCLQRFHFVQSRS